MRQFAITGMTCSACSARVERVVKKLPGINTCAVSLLTNSMSVEGTASDDEIIAAVVKAGYGAQSKAVVKNSASPVQDEELLEDHDTPVLEEASDLFRRLPANPSVYVYGTHDVELASSRFHEGQPCDDGDNTASSRRNNYGNQSKVFHQWLQKSSSRLT